MASSTEKLYECMLLIDSNKYSADPDGTITAVLEMISKAGGIVSAHRPWQDGKLAYEIEGQRKGLHYLVCFKSEESDTNTKLNRSVRLSDLVLRHLVVKHPPELYDALVQALGAGDETEEDGEGEEASAASATAGV